MKKNFTKKTIIFIVAVIILVGILCILINRPTSDTATAPIEELSKPEKNIPSGKDEKTQDNLYEIFSIASEDIKAFSFTNVDGVELSFVYDEKDTLWKFSDNSSIELNQKKIDEICKKISTIEYLEIESNVDPIDYGFGEELYQYTITDVSDNTMTFLISLYDEKYYLLMNDDSQNVYHISDTYVELSANTLEDLTK